MSPRIVAQELRFRDIDKSYGAVRALRGVTFAIREGEAHALVGENGAGKSTLMKILAGIVQPDRGRLEWKGRRLELRSPRMALDAGIGMVYQDLVLFPNLTASQNIFAGREQAGPAGWLRDREMRDRTRDLLAQLHVPISPDADVGSLSTAHQQLLQIARALAFDCRILILDEPTTSLTDIEAAHLFTVLARLRAGGVTLIYVSHKLAEVFRLCDRITVLRDGEYVGTFDGPATSQEAIVRAMVGRELETAPAVGPAASRRPLLEVTGLTRRPSFEGVSFEVGAGEVVGIFGLVGSGRSALLQTLFGLQRPDAGRIGLDGTAVRFDSPVDAVRAGLALVPEERRRQGLFIELDLCDNLTLPAAQARGAWRIDRRRERRTSRSLVERWRIRTPSLAATPDRLSGGNQQKVLLARWLATAPRLLMLDEPTRGVDVGAKYEIHAMIRAQAAEGMGCLLVSSELPEILVLSDRVLVMREGRLQGELVQPEATEEAVMRLATGAQ